VLRAFAAPYNRTLSVLLLVACGLLAAGAAKLGISDNPPGILLAFLSIAAFVTALVHPWRSARPFGLLAGGSLAAFAILVLLCALFDTLAKRWGPGGLLFGVLHALYGACLLGVMVCPSAFVVGAVGGLVMLARERHRSNTAA
jgi:hypothetical protein